jgi:hypothetical protein
MRENDGSTLALVDIGHSPALDFQKLQAADGDARALSVEFLRCGAADPAVAAGDEDILVASLAIGVTPFDQART